MREFVNLSPYLITINDKVYDPAQTLTVAEVLTILDDNNINYAKKNADEKVFIVDNEVYCRIQAFSLATRHVKVLPASIFINVPNADKYKITPVAVINITDNDVKTETGALCKAKITKTEAHNLILNHTDKTYWGHISEAEYEAMPVKRKRFYITISNL